MKELAKFITIISAIGHFLITFCKVGHETGEEVGTKVFEEAIVQTDSLDTMLVLQTGKNNSQMQAFLLQFGSPIARYSI